LRDYAITGSLALQRDGRAPGDIDLVVPSFAAIPQTLCDEFLCIHVHPNAEPGRLILQLVAPGEPIRIDIFSAVGKTLSRAVQGKVGDHAVRFVSMEDLASRLARTLLDLGRDKPVPAKFANDFRPIVDRLDRKAVEIAWQDHRADDDPESFDEACNQIAVLLALHDDLLIEQEYSKDADAVCSRCDANAGFPIASPRAILGILGYC
jgi:hypothetical protein